MRVEVQVMYVQWQSTWRKKVPLIAQSKYYYPIFVVSKRSRPFFIAVIVVVFVKFPFHSIVWLNLFNRMYMSAGEKIKQFMLLIMNVDRKHSSGGSLFDASERPWFRVPISISVLHFSSVVCHLTVSNIRRLRLHGQVAKYSEWHDLAGSLFRLEWS